MNNDKQELLSKHVQVTALAKFVGTDRAHISRVLNNKVSASDDLANRLAAACNMYTRRTSYFLKSDFILGMSETTDIDVIEQRIASIEIEIATRVMTIDDLRRQYNPQAGSILDAFGTMYRLMSIIEGMK